MADILQIQIDSKGPLIGNGTALAANVPNIARARAEKHIQDADTFARQFSSSPSSPTTELQSDVNATYEAQILPRLDFDRLEPKPKGRRRFHFQALLSAVVVCSILVPIACFLFMQRFADWRPTFEWLVASMSVGRVGGSNTQQELSADAENSAVAKRAVSMQSSEDRTDSTASSNASALAETVPLPQQDVEPHDAQRAAQKVATAIALTQSENPSLQRGVPSQFNSSVVWQGSKERPELDPVVISLLVKRGKELFKHGDLIGARTAFRRAAEAGNADAAVDMGATYDPIEFLALGVRGVDADIGETRRWYETAKRLGSAEASRRLDALASYY